MFSALINKQSTVRLMCIIEPIFSFQTALIQVSSQLRENKKCKQCAHEFSINQLELVYALNCVTLWMAPKSVRYCAHEFHHCVRCFTRTKPTACISEPSSFFFFWFTQSVAKKYNNQGDKCTARWSVLWCVLWYIQVNHYTQGTQLHLGSGQIFATLPDC